MALQTESTVNFRKNAQNIDMKECLQNCVDCYEVCIKMIPYCLGQGGRYAREQQIGLLSTCADICQASVKALSFQLDQHMDICRACAAVCESCADECERISDGDQELFTCADICLRCAESCGLMSSH